MRRIKKVVAGIMCCLLPWSIFSYAAAEEDTIELYARSAVLMDGDSGRILYEKEGAEALPMASTTKIMTCILALETAEDGLVCTVSQNAAAQPPVRLGMVKDDTFYLQDLLYSLMLESHNDTAVCIAETIGGSVEGFAAMMNEKAAEIGCQDTYYITPNGLDAEDENGVHHTTAADLALVMRYCLTQSPAADEFLTVTRTISYSFTNIAGSRSYSCTNHNTFLTLMDGALSGKTGFTGNAGYCYVGALKRDGKLLVVALLACGWPNNKGYKWVDTRKLMNYGLENYAKRSIVDAFPDTGTVAVQNGQTDFVETAVLQPEQGNTGADNPDTAQPENVTELLMKADEQVQTKLEMADSLTAPVEQGQQVGTIYYLVEGTEYASFPIITTSAVGMRDYSYCLTQIMEQFLL